MRTTLTLDDDIVEKIRERSRETGRPFKEILNETLRRGFLAEQTPLPVPFQVEAQPLGIKAGRSYDNVAELLEQGEGNDFR